ncbi:MAG: trigger factor [Vulcanimicrobiaceae bacterium]
MSATVKQLDPTRVEVEIAISPDDLEKARNHAYRELAKRAKIPGFRPGKVPRGIFEQHYGRGLIEERALDDVVPRAYSKAIEELDLYPVASPDIEFLPPDGEDSSVRVKATVAIRTEIALGQYKGVEIAGERETADDEDVSASLEALRREAAVLVPVDRAVRMGDIATLDYEGKIDGVSFEGGKAEQSPTEIEEGRFIPGFIEGIIGMKAGESKQLDVTFPADFPKTDLAGKNAVFAVTVHEVKERELPPVDDAFAERVAGRSMTLLELKMELRERLNTVAKTKARRTMAAHVVDKVLDMHDFPLPQVLVEHEMDTLLADTRNWVERTYGESPEQLTLQGEDASAESQRKWNEYQRDIGKTESELRGTFQPEAERRVKTSLLLGAIARAEGIDATPEDLERALEQLAAQYRQPKERMLELLAPNLGNLAADIIRTKTIDMLMDAASVVPATPQATA